MAGRTLAGHVAFARAPAGWDLSVVKLYQRRPGSGDALGLDHVDFLVPDGADASTILRAESDLHWAEEEGDYARWISLRFAGGPEAKLRVRGQTTLDAIIAELAETRDAVTGQKS